MRSLIPPVRVRDNRERFLAYARNDKRNTRYPAGDLSWLLLRGGKKVTTHCHSDDRKEEKSLTVGVVSRDSSRSTKGLGSE